jgi:hypothetical protein
MDIGGVDLPLVSIPRARYEPRAILGAIAEFWPHGIYQNADDTSFVPLSAVIEREGDVQDEEFFVFPNEASARDWAEHGATPTNANTMLHVLARDDPQDADLVETTLVIDDLDKEMAAIYAAINSALQDLQYPRASQAHQRRRSVDAELRSVGAALKPDEFSTLVDGLRMTLYPHWSQDELAYHPHDAMQFCEIVRSRVNAPVPDHLIMRVMMIRRKRGMAGKP